MQGLLQEASMIVCGMEQYYLQTSDNEGEAMCAFREKMSSTSWSHEWVAKRTMFAHGPEMSTVPLEAQFLQTLSTMKQPRRILEIGMFTGYGAATMLKGCENATLVSLEIDSFLKPWVRDGLASMPNLLSRREIEVGPALDTLEKMPSSEAFELVSIDANKSGYMRYVEVLIARGLLDKNAMIVADNTLYCGFPSTLSESCFLDVTEPKTRSNTTNDRDLIIVLFPGIILSCSSLTGPRIQSTSPNKWQLRSVQQSSGKVGNIEDTDEERDNTPEEIYETIYVKTINGKTISTRYYKNMTAAVILEEVERRTLVPRDMIRLVHKGKTISGKKSMKENNIEAKETIEMSLRLLGGMDVNEKMDTHETEEEREKKRKLDEGKEGKMTKPDEDMAHLKSDIMEALRKSDEKLECYSKRTEERMNDFSRKADDLLEKFMMITNTVGNQIHGMNSSIVKLQETNEKMKEDGENKFNQIDERFMDMEKKILDVDKKYGSRGEDNKQEHVNANQSETVITGLHSETTESEVINMLKEMMNEIGMDFGSARLVCPARPITHAFIYFANDDERNKFIRSANMLKREVRGRKIRITRSMEAEKRFYNKRMGYVKCCIHQRHGVPLYRISLNWVAKHVTVKGQIVVKTCQDGSLKFSKYQDVEDEVEEQMQKWQTTNSSQRL